MSKDKTYVDVEETYKLEPVSHGAADLIIKISRYSFDPSTTGQPSRF